MDIVTQASKGSPASRPARASTGHPLIGCGRLVSLASGEATLPWASRRTPAASGKPAPIGVAAWCSSVAVDTPLRPSYSLSLRAYPQVRGLLWSRVEPCVFPRNEKVVGSIPTGGSDSTPPRSTSASSARSPSTTSPGPKRSPGRPRAPAREQPTPQPEPRHAQPLCARPVNSPARSGSLAGHDAERPDVVVLAAPAMTGADDRPDAEQPAAGQPLPAADTRRTFR